MIKQITVTVFILILLSHTFAQDPANGARQYTNEGIVKPLVVRQPEQNASIVPPELILSLTASPNQDTVYVSFTSNQPLFTGWTETTLCSTYPDWNFWWLNTRLGIDTLDTLHVLVSLYNYSNSNYNFHRDVLDCTGNVVYQNPEWNGYQMQPIVKDGLGNNHYIGQPIQGWFGNMDAGAVDELNYIYSSEADTSGDVFFTKLDSIGNLVYDHIPVATGDTANSWSGQTQLDINSQGNIYIAWSRNMHEIVYSKSTDGGTTWDLPITIASDFTNQVNNPVMRVSPDDHIHFIWQHWTGSANCLIYKKLYPNGNCCVDTTNLTPNSYPSVWYPTCAIDADTNIHITWAPSSSGNYSLHYTLITGNLDKEGLPANDEEITLVQEYVFYSSAEQVRYPKIAVDSLYCPHIIFEQGEYGTHTTKTVYYIRETLLPQGYAVYPDSSIYELQVDTTGGYTSSFLTSVPGTYFVKVWAWNASGEVGWDTASINITGILEHDIHHELSSDLCVSPLVFTRMLKIKFSLSENTQCAHLKIYDASGRLIKQWDYPAMRQSDYIVWDGTDDSAKNVPAGVYFVRLETLKSSLIKKTVLLK